MRGVSWWVVELADDESPKELMSQLCQLVFIAFFAKCWHTFHPHALGTECVVILAVEHINVSGLPKTPSVESPKIFHMSTVQNTYLVGGFNPFENISQNESFPQIGVNIKNVWKNTT